MLPRAGTGGLCANPRKCVTKGKVKIKQKVKQEPEVKQEVEEEPQEPFPAASNPRRAAPGPRISQTMTTLPKQPRVVFSGPATPIRAPKAKRAGARTKAQKEQDPGEDAE